MASPPQLDVSNVPPVSGDEIENSKSPARGAEYAASLRARLLTNNTRVMALVHSWDFWYDRHKNNVAKDSCPVPKEDPSPSAPAPGTSGYEDRLEILASISDVRTFWSVFNNFDVNRLRYQDTIALFKKNVKPTWEDPRNATGGALSFRVETALAPDFFKEVCLMAIGEQLQQGVDSDRNVFRDDICGVTCSHRWQGYTIQIWTRDAEHAAGIARIEEIVVENLSSELKPKPGSYYYKKHAEHKDFGSKVARGSSGTSGT